MSYSEELYRNSILFRPIFIVVSEPDAKNGKIKIEYVPLITIFTKIMELSKHDVPYVYDHFGELR